MHSGKWYWLINGATLSSQIETTPQNGIRAIKKPNHVSSKFNIYHAFYWKGAFWMILHYLSQNLGWTLSSFPWFERVLQFSTTTKWISFKFCQNIVYVPLNNLMQSYGLIFGDQCAVKEIPAEWIQPRSLLLSRTLEPAPFGILPVTSEQIGLWVMEFVPNAWVTGVCHLKDLKLHSFWHPKKRKIQCFLVFVDGKLTWIMSTQNSIRPAFSEPQICSGLCLGQLEWGFKDCQK